jgi:transcriptional regulator with XRE-family HTH domain
MDFKEFGRRLRIIREEVLQMTQREIAQHLNMHQVMYSKVENGLGGNILFIFELMNFLHSRKLNAPMIFRESFELDLLTKKYVASTPDERSIELLSQVRETARSLYDKTTILMDMFAKDNP